MSGDASHSSHRHSRARQRPDDPYRWLEDVTGEQALSWVRERLAEAVAELTGGSRFEALRAEIREVLDSTDRIPYITRHGGYRYNFWRDREHPRGLWRRTTLAEDREEGPDWEILLDLDALARDEDENWVFHGAQCLRPDYRRALVSLSRGGADAAGTRAPSGSGGAPRRWPRPSWCMRASPATSPCPLATTTPGVRTRLRPLSCISVAVTGCAASRCPTMRSSACTGGGC